MNDSFIDIYIIPVKNIDDTSTKNVNLTWKLIYYETNVMRIKLNFSTPYDISPNLE